MDVRDCRTVRLPSSMSRRFAERRPGSIGHITLRGKCAGARSAGKPHAACDVAGAGNGLTVRLVRHSHRKRGETDRPRLRSTAPALDPTAIKTARRASLEFVCIFGQDGRRITEIQRGTNRGVRSTGRGKLHSNGTARVGGGHRGVTEIVRSLESTHRPRVRHRKVLPHLRYLTTSLTTSPSITVPTQWLVYSKGSPS